MEEAKDVVPMAGEPSDESQRVFVTMAYMARSCCVKRRSLVPRLTLRQASDAADSSS